MAKPKKEWPTYYVGEPDHLHALGVISNNYNEFEAQLYLVFMHHLDKSIDDFPQELSEMFYFTAPENKRLEYIERLFAIYEKDLNVLACLSALLKHFQWCSETRNTLIHAKHSPPMFKTADQQQRLYLSKRNKTGSTLNYMKLSLPHLRKIADHMRDGFIWCSDLQLFLYVRDTRHSHRSSLVRALVGTVALPEIPSPPKKLKLSQTPHNPPIPEHLLKPSGE
jgi:hypothetical protein